MHNFLDVLDLKPLSKKILLDIVTHGVSSVAQISSRLHIPKSTVYDPSPLLWKRAS
jgi:predicted transcriptional regulator